MKSNISINVHSSIRIENDGIIYVDPFKITDVRNDADIVLVTHEHHDHFSPEDISKVVKEDTLFVCPKGMENNFAELGIEEERVTAMSPGTAIELEGAIIEALPAYNVDKAFHPKENDWLGYIITLDGERIYIAGDTDMTQDNKAVSCDIAMVPIGGTYTMDASEAAALIGNIKPKVAIPTHYNDIVGTKDDEKVFTDKVGSDTRVVVLI